jgi:hypothetical protein
MYGLDFVNESIQSLGTPNEYCFDISRDDGKEGNDFNNPPVRVLIDFSSDFTNKDLQEQITKYSLNRRSVSIFVIPKDRVIIKNKDGEDEESFKKLAPVLIGSVSFNTIDSPWDVYPILQEHPLAVSALIDVCTAYHLKNLLPLQK